MSCRQIYKRPMDPLSPKSVGKYIPWESKDQTLPIGSRESFIWIILKTILCLVLDFQGIYKRPMDPGKWGGCVFVGPKIFAGNKVDFPYIEPGKPSRLVSTWVFGWIFWGETLRGGCW